MPLLTWFAKISREFYIVMLLIGACIPNGFDSDLTFDTQPLNHLHRRETMINIATGNCCNLWPKTTSPQELQNLHLKSSFQNEAAGCPDAKLLNLKKSNNNKQVMDVSYR